MTSRSASVRKNPLFIAVPPLQSQWFSSCTFLLALHFSHFGLANNFIRSGQNIRRNRDPYLLRCLQVDDELKLFWLLHWEVGGLGAFQTSIDKVGNSAIAVGAIGSVRHEPARFDVVSALEQRRQSTR